VGDPGSVIEAAFLGIKKASEVLDMQTHSGEHPRMGATDVCPLIPISNITMEETAKYAHKLGKRVGDELGIPGYFYENAALTPEKTNLAFCRQGEYEGLKKRLADPSWAPDFGPAEFNAKSGATAIGARDFLVAYNINLNTTSTRRANAIAFDIRERGRVKRKSNPLTGEIIRDKNGNPEYIPGSLKSVKGIGWYIDEYGIAQLSLNLTNISITPIHIAFEEASRKAEARGIRVTGSELVGLVPLNAMLDAGKYFLRKQKRSLGVSESELIKIAVKSLGLEDLGPFNPEERIIEYMLDAEDTRKLIDMSLTDFADETASESIAPGGGSISAYVGALGVSLGTMVANLSSHKRGWDDKWEEYSDWAKKGQAIKDKLLKLVDEDTNAFNQLITAMKMPRITEKEKTVRKQMMDEATKNAILVPLQVMKLSLESMEILKNMVNTGLQSSVSDAGVGASCARTAVTGAFLNVKINIAGMDDPSFTDKILIEAQEIQRKADSLEKEILKLVDKKISIT